MISPSRLRVDALAPWLVGALLVLAAGAAVVRVLHASALGRVAAVLAAALLVGAAAGAVRGRAWALGSAFFLGLCWLWAVVALGLQQRISATAAAGWMAWAVTVLVASVLSRRHG